MKKFFKHNGLSIVFVFLFIISLFGQLLTGLKEHNKEMAEEGGKQASLSQYVTTGHFIQATFENWESEFLQMALFVVFTIFLFQKGSSESKDMDGEEEVDKEPDPNKEDAPWPVKKGGLISDLYKNSLTITLIILFILSFILHWYGSLKNYNNEQELKGERLESAIEYLSNSRLWFESFQNWQSEFMSIFAIVILSVFLRQKGSPQSKPVDAPHSETGE